MKQTWENLAKGFFLAFIGLQVIIGYKILEVGTNNLATSLPLHTFLFRIAVAEAFALIVLGQGIAILLLSWIWED